MFIKDKKKNSFRIFKKLSNLGLFYNKRKDFINENSSYNLHLSFISKKIINYLYKFIIKIFKKKLVF